MNAIELLAAGAALSATTFATEAVKDAYENLKRLLVKTTDDPALLSTPPSAAVTPSPELCQALLSAESTREVQDALRALLAAITAEPGANLARARIDLTRLTVGSHVILEDISAEGGVGISESNIAGMVKISNVTAGESKKK